MADHYVTIQHNGFNATLRPDGTEKNRWQVTSMSSPPLGPIADLRKYSRFSEEVMVALSHLDEALHHTQREEEPE